MGEFGHIAFAGRGLHIDAWGAGPFHLTAAGRLYRFEDSDRFGPHLLTRSGDIRSHSVPSERSPFWGAYKAWVAQGRRVDADGMTCVLFMEPPS